ncbi:MAG TPA: IS1 family transposase [Thermoanaerobaculia bacterium]|nr:IS1 family transposase [Thermoanaerobaculia bacterium]
METTHTCPACPKCSAPSVRWGKDANNHQRFRCSDCKATFAERPARPLGSMRIPFDRAVLCLSILTEGGSIRSAERITGTHRDTICRLLVKVGGKCEALLESLVCAVQVENVQADELWSYVGMKERTKSKQGIVDPKLGDAYCFVGMDADSKLVLAHHLGRRTSQHADLFAEKLALAIDPEQRFQLSSDSWGGFPAAFEYHFGNRVDYGTILKEFGSPGADELRRYAPPQLIGVEKTVVSGAPDEEKICTSHVERNNLTIRTSMKRMTRLTCAFSKKWENLRAALALNFAAYNLCRTHRSIRMTPAMKAGVTRAPWTLAQLVAA